MGAVLVHARKGRQMTPSGEDRDYVARSPGRQASMRRGREKPMTRGHDTAGGSRYHVRSASIQRSRGTRSLGQSRSGSLGKPGNSSTMLLVLDNYDSFTWNLVQFLGELGAHPVVLRNDEVSLEEALARRPERVVISPGPCTPAMAGISVELIRQLPAEVPVLGVCLGHQAIGEAFGGRTIRAERVMHGKAAPVEHRGDGIFQGLPSPLSVARYHSLVTDPLALPECLEVVAWSEGGAATRVGGPSGVEIQAVRHRERPVWGVQFHPESLFSEQGHALLANFLALG